ncbi:pre-mRNA-splicing factor SPF27-like [Oscarella lobularis]|uniref:pre-mRNA-splicing factor SPF27-like n=1 Tax=Oscarella lobularis TaxID=121494 RepID=UPI00331402AD
MAGDFQLDSLPYYDQVYNDPSAREVAAYLIEEETQRYRPTKNYLDYLPPLTEDKFLSPVLEKEFERIGSNLPLEQLNMKRYELPPPSSAQRNDIRAWTESVNNSAAQLEHQATRIVNLELLAKYGAAAWKMHNESLQRMVEQQQKQLQALRSQIQEMNWQRKEEQTKAGAELQQLEYSWYELVRKNIEIEKAVCELEQQIRTMKGPENGEQT